MQVRELLQGAKPAQQEELYRSARQLLLDGGPEASLQRALPLLEVLPCPSQLALCKAAA
jgi:hypothetical protein